jgi:hypothetical protein
MKTRCPYTETLYQLPGFFTQIAAAINEINGSSSFFVSEIWFPQPAIDALPPTPASEEVGKEIWKHKASNTNIEEQKRNQYEEALNQVWQEYWNWDNNNVIIVLTDGTFSEGITINEKQAEKRNISEKLKILSNPRGKVYLLLCGNPREDESPWLEQGKLAGLYKLEDLPAQINDLAKALFGEGLSGNQYNIKMGWLTGTTSVTLPGETITFTAKIATVGLEEPWIDYSEGRPPLSCDSGLCKLKRGFERFTQPGPSCKAQEMMVNLGERPFLGFYLVRGYIVPPWKYQSEPSVNGEIATLIISLEHSLYFKPINFEECFYVEMDSVITTRRLISGHFQNAQATLAWQPLSDLGPGDYEGSLRIKSISGQNIVSWPVTLSVRFKPVSVERPVTLTPIPGDKYRTGELEYQYVPQGVTPTFYLCSKYTDDQIKEINKRLPCGKYDICCVPEQSDCSIYCPIPTPCPQEVSKFCGYCVPVNLSQLCAPSAGAIHIEENSGPPKFKQNYKITLFKCLIEHCGYTYLLIHWPTHPQIISFTDCFELKGDTFTFMKVK